MSFSQPSIDRLFRVFATLQEVQSAISSVSFRVDFDPLFTITSHIFSRDDFLEEIF